MIPRIYPIDYLFELINMFDFVAFQKLYYKLCDEQVQKTTEVQQSKQSRYRWGNHEILSNMQMKKLFSSTNFQSARELQEACSLLSKLNLCYLQGKLWGFEHPDSSSQKVIAAHLQEVILKCLKQGGD